jgi:hypothetical protein
MVFTFFLRTVLPEIFTVHIVTERMETLSISDIFLESDKCFHKIEFSKAASSHINRLLLFDGNLRNLLKTVKTGGFRKSIYMGTNGFQKRFNV